MYDYIHTGAITWGFVVLRGPVVSAPGAHVLNSGEVLFLLLFLSPSHSHWSSLEGAARAALSSCKQEGRKEVAKNNNQGAAAFPQSKERTLCTIHFPREI